MTDPRLNPKPGYKHLPSANSWPMTVEGNTAAVTKPKEVVECEDKGHRISSYSTRYGYHHFWCTECRYEYFMDSGD